MHDTTMAAQSTVRVTDEEGRAIRIGIQFNDPRRTRSGNGLVVLKYRVLVDEPLRRIFLDFCNRLDLIYGNIRFIHYGKRIQETDTAEGFEMEDDDVVDAFSEVNAVILKEQEFIRIGIHFHDFQRSSSANPVTPIELKYRTPTDEPLHRIILDFCNRLNLDYTDVRFYYNGVLIRETDTPHRFRMCEEDIVDALPNLRGCRCGCNDGTDSSI